MTVGSNLGAPGTRVTKQLGPVSELLLYVWQAIIGALAIDTALFLVMCSWLIIGWLAIPLLFAAACFAVTLFLFTFARMSDKLRFIIGNLWMVGMLVGFVAGYYWHEAATAGMQAIIKEIGVVFGLPWWVYALVGVGLVLIAFRSVAAAIVALIGAGVGYILLTTDPDTWLVAWHSLKWLLLPYLWPFVGFACLLALVMAKEMLFPSLEWTFKPVSLEELREVGLFGLWLPRLLGGPREPPPVAERIVQVEMQGEHGNQYATLPDTDAARNFYRAIKRGESFSIRTAKKYQVGRVTFNSYIRDIFRSRKWADWRDDDHPEQGIELNEDGWLAIENLVLTGSAHPPTG